MELHKLFPNNNPYYFWALISVVMQVQIIFSNQIRISLFTGHTVAIINFDGNFARKYYGESNYSSRSVIGMMHYLDIKRYSSR